MSAPRVLVITPQYAPDFGPSAPIYTALCEDLRRLGCAVTVATGFPHYGGAQEQFPPGSVPRREASRNGVAVRRVAFYVPARSTLLNRLLYHASVNLALAWEAMRAGPADVVLADAPVLWSGLPLLFAALLRRRPYIYVVHDIYPDVLVRLGVLKNPLALRLLNWVERWYYRRAGRISVLSDGAQQTIVAKGVPREKIVVVPACVDVDLLRPLPRDNELRRAWGLAGKFVVLYAGNLGHSQDLETVLCAARRLQPCPDIAFVFVGEGAAKPRLQALAAEWKLPNVHFYPFQPREQVGLVYALADAALVPLRRGIVSESLPSKTYTIMASGRPLIASVSPESETGRLIAQAGCGLLVPPEDESALAEAVLRLRDDLVPPGRAELGARGRAFVVAHYSRQVAAERYLAAIQSVAVGWP